MFISKRKVRNIMSLLARMDQRLDELDSCIYLTKYQNIGDMHSPRKYDKISILEKKIEALEKHMNISLVKEPSIPEKQYYIKNKESNNGKVNS